MTFQELCLSDPHRRCKGHAKPFAVLVQTRIEKVWRLYKASHYGQAEGKAFGSDDCLDVVRIVPISDHQYQIGIANMKKHTNYCRRKAKKTWAG